MTDLAKTEELIKTTELCQWLKISSSTAMRWRNEGMPYIGKGRSLRYRKTEVQKWLEEQEEQKDMKGE